jgi:Fe-S oxidoreductase
MALEDYRSDMETCCRCSACKFIPMEKITGFQYANICPSVKKYNFHTYSGGGRMGVGVAMLDKRIKYTDKLLEVVYNCMTCGGCDISCKYAMDMEVLEPIYEMRIKCVEAGHTIPALDRIITSLRKQGPMVLGTKVKRGDWCEKLDVKDFTKQKTKVIYHAGCMTCYDKNMWKLAKANISLLQKAGVDFGIAREHESCCGGRAYQMGYKKDAIKQAHNMDIFQKSGAEVLVTGCADCYHAFKVLYDKFGLKNNMEILHITAYFDRLTKEGKLKPKKEIRAKVTYHDPCHLGRLGEPYIHWQGKQVQKHMRIFDPPRTFRRGTYGIYEPPRDILRSIPGIKLVEMDRIKEYAWCCGSGGGVKETNPEFANWTANDRVKEAESTGAEALVSACPHCEIIFSDAIKQNGSLLKVYDVVELLEKSI